MQLQPDTKANNVVDEQIQREVIAELRGSRVSRPTKSALRSGRHRHSDRLCRLVRQALGR